MDSCRDSVIKQSAGLVRTMYIVQAPDRPGSKAVESVEKQAQGHHGRPLGMVVSTLEDIVTQGELRAEREG